MTTQLYSFVLRELANNSITVHMEAPFTSYDLRDAEGQVLATVSTTDYAYAASVHDTLGNYFSEGFIKTLVGRKISLFFHHSLQACIVKHEPLVCTVCDECQIVARAKGAPSQKQKCKMTVRCEGIVRRIEPRVFDLVVPKRPRVKRGPRSIAPVPE
jgi:hypothetical protein